MGVVMPTMLITMMIMIDAVLVTTESPDVRTRI